MKRSSYVPAALLTAVAATYLLFTCEGPTEVERCVDDQGNILPDEACGSAYVGGYHTHGGIMVIPHYIYGGEVQAGRLYGGSRSPSGNAHVTNASGRTITRAGFGGSSSRGSFGRIGGFGGFGG